MALKTFSGRRASQNEQELNAFVGFLKSRGVKRYLEIGARHGDTFHHIVQSLGKGASGLAVDLPGGLWGTEASRFALTAAIEDLQKQGFAVDLLFGNSHDYRVARKIQSKGPFDAVLIDGDHTLLGVRRDFGLYADCAPIIAFHDIVGIGEREKVSGRPVQVPEFWTLAKEEFEHEEFIAPDSTMGIGVLWR